MQRLLMRPLRKTRYFARFTKSRPKPSAKSAVVADWLLLCSRVAFRRTPLSWALSHQYCSYPDPRRLLPMLRCWGWYQDEYNPFSPVRLLCVYLENQFLVRSLSIHGGRFTSRVCDGFGTTGAPGRGRLASISSKAFQCSS